MNRLLTPLAAVLISGAALASGTDGETISVGVTEFDHEGYGADGVAAAARGLVEEQLSRHARLVLVERSRLADLLEEVSFQQSGITMPEGAAEIGVGHNVQLLVFGQASRRAPREFHLALRIVDVATGRVLRVEETTVDRDGNTFDRRVRESAHRLVTLALAGLPADDVLIPAGVFPMGSTRFPEEGPVHEVRLDAFRIDRTEVSQGAFFAWLESRGRPAIFPEDPDLPATRVNWQDAADYCGWVSRRLPTEAEWERAGRGPVGNAYPWGPAAPSPRTARFSAKGPVAVFELPGGASAEGALNLSGNVAEWVADWYDPRYYARSGDRNPQGPDLGDYRVIRGGGFSSPADELRVSARGFHNALRGADHIGFRCAVSVKSTP
ncbi:MAG: SUMF1/EgtB/PvdO family nonheme iron enzyme [Candidatus Latescibacteria bacterium]|nr:SUMF1/EgtB/PvdO family nonheme iron enzyme [Candidatus Latescibacterota bacterium]